MRHSLLAILVSFAIALAGTATAASSEQCLPAADLSNLGRMAAVMAMGVAVQRCGQCLGPDYAQTLHAYDDANLMADFWKAQKNIGSTGDTLARIDVIMRDSARKLASSFSGDCDACRRTAEREKKLSSADERNNLYGTETETIKASGVAACP